MVEKQYMFWKINESSILSQIRRTRISFARSTGMGKYPSSSITIRDLKEALDGKREIDHVDSGL